MGFRPAGFVLVRWIQALYELISALSWAFLDASKELVLISKGFRKKVAEKAHFGLGPRLESPRFEWTWKQADCVRKVMGSISASVKSDTLLATATHIFRSLKLWLRHQLSRGDRLNPQVDV